MNDPLNPGPVRLLERDNAPAPKEDQRPFWKRFFTSLRPSVGVETSKKTGKRIGTVELKGHAEF